MTDLPGPLARSPADLIQKLWREGGIMTNVQVVEI